MFSVEEKFGIQITKIWNNEKFKDFKIDRGFVIQDNILKNSIMFVGINPSFSEKKSETHAEFCNIESEGKGHPYFSKFKEISSHVKHHWTHFDLLYFRETNQKYINELLRKPDGIKFISLQLEISKKVICEAKPKILIVSNATARDFMGFGGKKTKKVCMDFEFEFDEKLGTHKIVNHPELKDTLVFFTSMLTGQRALDNGSFARLKWHIHYILNHLSATSAQTLIE